MKLKNAALFALVGMILLTVLQAAGFIRLQIGPDFRVSGNCVELARASGTSPRACI